MVAGASEDTGLAKERRRLTFPAEEIADERDEVVLESLQATVGCEAGMRRHHHSQQLGVESSVHGERPLNLQSKCILGIKIKSRESACPIFLAPLVPMML